MIRVESLDDPRVADYRSITDPAAMRRAGLFVAEGRFVVARLLKLARFRVRSILLTDAAFRQLGAAELSAFSAQRSGPSAFSAQLSALSALEPTALNAESREPMASNDFALLVADQRVMDGIVGFNIHRGCVALAERPPTPALSDMPLAALNRVVVLEGVNNPDNIGGLFRSAAAFGVDAVILGPGCADPLYRKAIRTSMAATLQVPFAAAGIWPDALSTLRADGLRVLALTPAHDATLLDDLPRRPKRVALLVGTEGSGLTMAAMAHADARVRIRTTTEVDSLNVTVATSIALHHFSSRVG